MSWRAYRQLPHAMQNDSTAFYYDIIKNKRIQLIIKRISDIILSFVLLVLLLPLMLGIALLIRLDGKGEIVFKQVRIKRYLEEFTIYKFRTMRKSEDNISLTCENDTRITKVGAVLRRLRLDELPQLYNILKGDMSFVGPRPEIPKFVDYYTEEMLASFLMPVGLTCTASIKFKNEAELLKGGDHESIYINKILPCKMKYNIEYLKQFSLKEDFIVIFKTIVSVFNE